MPKHAQPTLPANAQLVLPNRPRWPTGWPWLLGPYSGHEDWQSPEIYSRLPWPTRSSATTWSSTAT
jgi:hypothetical protein